MVIKEEITKLLQKAVAGLQFQVEEVLLEHPENPSHGDYSTNVALVLGKKLGKNPRKVAESIVTTINYKLKPINFIERVEAVDPGFINFFLKTEFFVQELSQIVKQKEKYGAGKAKEKIIVEYSSPNIAKSFGVGHLRSTIIGQAIYNVYAFLGYKCIGINYPGDWGTPHGKIIFQLHEKLLKGKTDQEQNAILASLTVGDLERLYVEFHEEAKTKPEIQEAARAWFKKLEDGDKEARLLWEKAKIISMFEFEKIYDLLDVRIDYLIGESFFEDKMKQIIGDFKSKNLAKESQDAFIVEFPGNTLTPAMLLKSDGATTYFTRDLANLKYRLKRWKPDTIVIETGVEQQLHFKQVFAAAKLVGYVEKEKLIHVFHGLYRSKEGKFSTRKGQTIHLEEVLSEAVEKARKIIEESETARGLSEKEKTKVAKSVGIGGIKYNDLSQHPAGDIVFDWDKILNLQGNSAPYLQYTYARCKSILRKSEIRSTQPRLAVEARRAKSETDPTLKFSKEELDILRTIYRFPEVVRKAAEKFSPNLVAQFAFDLAQKYNLFYNTSRVLEAETEEGRNFRLLLTAGVAQLLKNSLSLLGIAAPERM